MARLTSPFTNLINLQQALDAFRTSGWLDAGISGSGAYPPINVFRMGDEFALVAEAPGVKKSDLEVQIKGRTVRISGSKAVHYPQGASVHRRERLEGRFDRVVTLPTEIDPEHARAECRDGVLALTLSRAESDKPKTIKVT
jgi:HSP20 family protein